MDVPRPREMPGPVTSSRPRGFWLCTGLRLTLAPVLGEEDPVSHGHHRSRVQGPPGPRAAQGRVGAGRVERRSSPPN